MAEPEHERYQKSLQNRKFALTYYVSTMYSILGQLKPSG
jgi:hypothetical protein